MSVYKNITLDEVVELMKSERTSELYFESSQGGLRKPRDFRWTEIDAFVRLQWFVKDE